MKQFKSFLFLLLALGFGFSLIAPLAHAQQDLITSYLNFPSDISLFERRTPDDATDDDGGGGGGGGTTGYNSRSGGSMATYQCNDGIDNDEDGLIDYPADPDCSGPTDNSEASETETDSGFNPNIPIGECNDGIDNDGDGKTDFGFDPGCSSPYDPSEFNVPKYECNDGIDNDGDGKTDFGFDMDCETPYDNSEGAGAALPTTGPDVLTFSLLLTAVGLLGLRRAFFLFR